MLSHLSISISISIAVPVKVMPLLTNKTITVDITSSAIRLLLASGDRVERWADAYIEPGLVSDGIVTDAAEMGDRIIKLMKSSRIRGKKVMVSVSGLYSVSRLVNLPHPNGHSREEMMSDLIADIVPLSPEEFYTSWKIVGTNGNGHRALFFGTPINIIDSVLSSLKCASLKPAGLNLKSMALLKLIDRQQALVANIEMDSADIILIADALPQVVRTIRRGMDVDMDEWVKDIETNMRQTILFFNTRFGGRRLEPEAPLYLTGKLATDPAIAGELSELIGCPLDGLPVPLECPPNMPTNQFAVNIGLAIKQPHILPMIEHTDWEADDVEQ